MGHHVIEAKATSRASRGDVWRLVAEVTLADAPGGTEITWHSEFDTTWPPGIKSGLERFLPTTVEALARGAETG